MVALDIDASLKGIFQQIVHHLENLPKPQGENISAITCDLSVCGDSYKSFSKILNMGNICHLNILQFIMNFEINILALS